MILIYEDYLLLYCKNNTGQPCTVWAPAPVQTDPASLTNPGGTPLGFRSLTLPGAGSQNQGHCVRVFYDNTTNTDYIFVAVSEMYDCQENCSTLLSALAQEAVDLNVAGTTASSMQRYRACLRRERDILYTVNCQHFSYTSA